MGIESDVWGMATIVAGYLGDRGDQVLKERDFAEGGQLLVPYSTFPPTLSVMLLLFSHNKKTASIAGCE